MTELTHHTRNIRLAPRKVRLVVDKIRHKHAEDAAAILTLVPNRAAVPVRKAVLAAIDAAKAQGMDTKTLIIQRAWADEGAALKRIIPHSRGQAWRIMKKYSHVGLVLKPADESAKR